MRKKRLTIALLLLALTGAPTADAGVWTALKNCGTRIAWTFGIVAEPHAPIFTELGTPLRVANDGSSVLSDGHLVTGPDDFPLSVVLHHLGYETKKPPQLEGTVLVLGDGHGHLFPALRSANVNVKALDLWYAHHGFPWCYAGRQMQKFCDQWRPHLIAGDARRTKLRDESFDRILSHQLVAGMSLEDGEAVLREVVRLLKVGGEARIYGFSLERVTELMALLEAPHLALSQEYRASQFRHPYVGPTGIQGRLLIIRKQNQ